MQSKINDKIDAVCLQYRKKVEAILSVCESPIEKYFLIGLIDFYTENSLVIYTTSFLYDIVREDNYGNIISNYKIEKTDKSFFELSTAPTFIYGLRISHSFFHFNFEIEPQKVIQVPGGKTYRVDFGITGTAFSKIHKDKKTEFNIFIECDGYDYHKTPEQINNDNTRANQLKAIGWMEFRYSGKNINSENFNAAVDFDKFIMSYVQPQDEMLDGDFAFT